MGEPIKSGEVERTESFDRQGNQTTGVFIRTTYFDYSPEYKNKMWNFNKSFVCISFHSCSIIEFRTAISMGAICNNMFRVTRLTGLKLLR